MTLLANEPPPRWFNSQGPPFSGLRPASEDGDHATPTKSRPNDKVASSETHQWRKGGANAEQNARESRTMDDELQGGAERPGLPTSRHPDAAQRPGGDLRTEIQSSRQFTLERPHHMPYVIASLANMSGSRLQPDSQANDREASHSRPRCG